MKLFRKGKYLNSVQKVFLFFAALYGLVKLAAHLAPENINDIILFWLVATFVTLIYIGERLEDKDER